MSFDRCFCEAMREELLDQKVVDPVNCVRSNGGLFACLCDQIPMWLRMGSARQLCKSVEATRKKRKRHETVKAGEVSRKGDEVRGQVVECHAEDGMAQMRQDADGVVVHFRLTLETSQMVHHQFKLSEAPEVRHGRPVLATWCPCQAFQHRC